MKCIKVDLPQEIRQLEIHTFADLHIGDENSRSDLIASWVRDVERKDNAYCILNGDLMNTAITGSKSDVYAEDLSIMEQVKKIASVFKPLADKGKILGILSGNHEDRIYKATGVDITYLIANELGCEDRYTETTGVIFLSFGSISAHKKRKMQYSIYFTHGSGGGRREGGKINRLADYASIVDTDIYICSHTHLPATFKEAFYRLDWQNKSMTKVTKLFVNTGAMLDYGGYGDKLGFKPSSNDMPTIVLNGERKEMRCVL